MPRIATSPSIPTSNPKCRATPTSSTPTAGSRLSSRFSSIKAGTRARTSPNLLAQSGEKLCRSLWILLTWNFWTATVARFTYGKTQGRPCTWIQPALRAVWTTLGNGILPWFPYGPPTSTPLMALCGTFRRATWAATAALPPMWLTLRNTMTSSTAAVSTRATPSIPTPGNPTSRRWYPVETTRGASPNSGQTDPIRRRLRATGSPS